MSNNKSCLLQLQNVPERHSFWNFFFFVKWLSDKRLNNVVRYSSLGCCLLFFFCFRIIAELCSFEKKRKIWPKMHLIRKLAKISSNQKWNEIFFMISWPCLKANLSQKLVNQKFDSNLSLHWKELRTNLFSKSCCKLSLYNLPFSNFLPTCNLKAAISILVLAGNSNL